MLKKLGRICLWNMGMGAIVFIPLMFAGISLINQLNLESPYSGGFWIGLLNGLGYLYFAFLVIVSLGAILHSLLLSLIPMNPSQIYNRVFTVILAFIIPGVYLIAVWVTSPNAIAEGWYFGLGVGTLGYGLFAKYPQV